MTNYYLICNTQYTLLNLIALQSEFINDKVVFVYFLRDRADILLLNNLKNKGIVESIIVIDFINKNSYLDKILLFLFPLKFLKSKYLISGDFSMIENNGHIVSCNYFYAFLFKRLSSNFSVSLVEEGLSTYTGRAIQYVNRSLILRIFLSLFDSWFWRNGKKVYLNNENVDNLTGFDIKKIPRFDDEKLLDIIHCFSAENERYDGIDRFIFLGTPSWGLIDLLEDKKVPLIELELRIQAIYEALFTKLKDRIFYKMHPLECDVKLAEKYSFERLFVTSWDAWAGINIRDTDVIVSFFSTGAISPKYIFNNEPVVIFLYKLLDHKFYGADKCVSNFKDACQRRNVFVPESIEELESILTDLKK